MRMEQKKRKDPRGSYVLKEGEREETVTFLTFKLGFPPSSSGVSLRTWNTHEAIDHGRG